MMREKLLILLGLFFITFLQACTQSKGFTFESDIRSAFDMNDSLVYFCYELEEENTGPKFKLSDIKKTDTKRLDSLYFPKIKPMDNDHHFGEPYLANTQNDIRPDNGSYLKTSGMRNPSYNLCVGNINFTVDIDFEKCILYDIYNYYGYPGDAQIAGFSYDKVSGEPVAYRAYNHSESGSHQTLEEKRYFFTDKSLINEKDVNGTAKEKKDLYALGIKIHKVVKQLLLTYKSHCPPQYLSVTVDSTKLKNNLDSIFALLSNPEYDQNKENIKLKSMKPKLTMQIEIRTSDVGSSKKIHFSLYGSSQSGIEQVYMPRGLGAELEKALKRNLSFNQPAFMCMPCDAVKKMTIVIENNKVTRFYY